jgi:Adenylate cyclase, class 2 (thermophilic)
MKRAVVKAKLKNKIDFLKTLADIDLEFGETYYQHDRIFLPRGYKPDQSTPKAIIRTNVKRTDKAPTYYLILKRHVKDQDVDIVHRTSISDYSETAYILHQLGFELSSEVIKQRQNLTMDGGIEICIDKVDNLGTFVKIESNVGEGEDPKLIRKDLEKTLEVLDIKSNNVIDNTYANLLSKKK